MSDPNRIETDFLVIGSGCAGLTAALRASSGGLSVTILEKAALAGGASAMSGGGIWIPANHHARAAGLSDSPDEALQYLRATAPPGWHNSEDLLWRRFAATAPIMLEFVEQNTPLRFALTNEPDPMAEYAGGKKVGRMVSPRLLSRKILGPYAQRIRRSTLPHIFTYQEVLALDPYHHPVRTGFRLLPALLRRRITDSIGQGNALVAGLLKACLDRSCRLLLATRAQSLMLDDRTGGVVGVTGLSDGKPVTIRARRGVLLATGGFEWNTALVERHFGGRFQRIGSPRSNEGDGQRMAEAAGARLDRMDQANIYPLLPVTYEGQPSGIPATFQAAPHAILVDRHGRRFVSELSYNLGEALDRRDPSSGELLHVPAYVIADSRYLRHGAAFRWYASHEKGWVIKGTSLEEIAGRIGIPAATLKATVERFNRFCEMGRDEDFHRGESVWEHYKLGRTGVALGKIEQPPFYAMAIDLMTVGTKGGVRTNNRAQALRQDHTVIPGLLAAGNAMANPIGTRAIGAGTTLGPCMTWGYVAAETVLGNS
ncbi:MAG TPA: FAD-dependent oxidoreductase [Stellaceae bacterium]|nr:FAD-dependent oxidoreductase [Stellaceae bacterium]